MKIRFGRFWRAAVIVVAALILLLLAGTLALRLYGNHRLDRVMARFGREVGSLELREYMLKPVPRMENASTWLEGGSGGIVLTRRDKRLMGRVHARDAFEFEPAEREQIREILERCAPALELLRRARDLERSSYGIRYWNARDAKLPPLLELMHARDVLYLDGALALSEQRTDDALEAYETLASLAASLQRERFIIILLMGLHTERTQLRLARGLLTSGVAEDETLDRLERRIADNDLLQIGRETLAADTASMMASMRYGTVGFWGARWFQAAYGSLLSAQILEGHRRFGERLSLTYPAYLENKPQFNDLGFGRLYLYDMHVTKGLLDAALSQRRLTRLAIGLQRLRLAQGAFPESLDRLPAAAELDRLTETRPTYERRADGSAHLELPGAEEMLRQLRPNDRTARLYRFDF